MGIASRLGGYLFLALAFVDVGLFQLEFQLLDFLLVIVLVLAQRVALENLLRPLLAQGGQLSGLIR